MLEQPETVMGDLQSIEHDRDQAAATIQQWLQEFVQRIQGEIPTEGVPVSLPQLGVPSGTVVRGEQGLHALLNNNSKVITAI
jgi:hypothetical protein